MRNAPSSAWIGAVVLASALGCGGQVSLDPSDGAGGSSVADEASARRARIAAHCALACERACGAAAGARDELDQRVSACSSHCAGYDAAFPACRAELELATACLASQTVSAFACDYASVLVFDAGPCREQLTSFARCAGK